MKHTAKNGVVYYSKILLGDNKNGKKNASMN